MRVSTRMKQMAAAALLAGGLIGTVAAAPASAAAHGLPSWNQWDGQLVQRAGTGELARIVGDGRMTFTDREELREAGCDGTRVTTLPPRVFDAIPEQPDRLYAAVTDDVDVDRITPDPQYRQDCHAVYRADGRGPDEVFNTGFAPWDVEGQYDITSYVLQNQPSPFVSTTYRDDLYRAWKSPYYYVLDLPGGVDVNSTIGDDHKYADQEEVAFPGGIRTEFIVEGCAVDTETFEIDPDDCVANPNYVPWRQ